MTDSNPKIFKDIEQTAGYYGAATYTGLLSFFHDYDHTWELSDFIPITSVVTRREREHLLFAVGVLPPAANVTGKLLDRSASVLSLADQEKKAAVKAATSKTSAQGDQTAGDSGTNPDPTPTGGKNSLLHQWARQVMHDAFVKEMGREPTIEEVQYIQAVAFIETGYGRWPQPEMQGSNNWGAIHCNRAQQINPLVQKVLNTVTSSVGIDPNCIPSHDKNSAGQTFAVSFKAYGTPEEGAQDVVKRIMKGQPKTAASLAAGDPVFNVSYNMRRDHYYGGFCPDAVKQYGASAGSAGGLSNPDRDEGTAACAQEAITAHATSVKRAIDDIAAANHDPSAMAMGTFADADKAWRDAVAAAQAGDAVAGDATSGDWAGKGSTNAKDAAKENEKSAGTPLNSTELGQKFQQAQKAQILITQAALAAMAATPPLKMLVNPQKFGVKGEKIVSDGNWSRTGPIVSHWGDGQDKISASGKIAAFYAIDVASAGGPGLTRSARNYTESYANFQALYTLYRNNGGIYLTDPLTKGQTHNLSQVGSIYIYYDSTLYIGSFDSFNITESDSSPFSLEYSFEFTVRAAFLLDRNDDEFSYGAPGLIPSIPAHNGSDLFSTPK